MMKRSFALSIAALFATTAASAQITPINATTSRLQLSFTGIVTNDVTNTIMIRQPDGSFSKFTGPVPDYPYKVGDQIAVTFSTVVPTKAYYDQPQFAGQKAADGIYRFNLLGPGLTGTNGIGVAQGADVSGPATVYGGGSQPYSFRGLTVVYDANKDGYSLELPTNLWSLAPLNMPSYRYDPVTGMITSVNLGCVGVQCEPDFNLRGDATSAGIAQTALGDKIFIQSTQTPDNVGFFDALRFSGSWNLPYFNGGGDPVDVPEPSMVILFGAGAAAMMRRRRTRAFV
jgi:PEP-CTERM motif